MNVVVKILSSLAKRVYASALIIFLSTFAHQSAVASDWTGNTSSNWHTAGNWSSGIPTGTTAAIIKGSPNNPIISTADASASNLTIESGASLTLQNGRILTTTSSDGLVEIQSGGTLNLGNGTLIVLKDFTRSGTFNAGTGTIVLSGTGSMTGSAAYYNLTINSARTMPAGSTLSGRLTLQSSTLSSAGNLTLAAGATIERSAGALSGTPVFGTSVNVIYTGSGALTTGTELPASTSVLNNLTMNRSGTVTLGAARTVNGTLTLTQGTFSNGSNLSMASGSTISRDTGTLSSAPTFSGTVNVVYTGATGVTTGNELPTSTTALNNLTINKSGGVTLNAAKTVNGTLTLTAGTLSIGSNTLSLNGAIFTASGTLTGGGTSNLTIGGAGASTTLPAVTLNNMTINRANGISLGGNVTVGGTLTFTTGTITTGANTLYSTGTVARTSGHVIGNFNKTVATGATSKTFEIGGASAYTPVTAAFASVTTAGSLTASTTSSDHASIGSSTINAAKSVNRNWTLSNSGIVFTNYDATFTFVPGDVDGGANPNAFIVGKYGGGSWTYPTVGTKTSTSTQATGLTSFGDFEIGEMASSVKTWDGGAATNNWGDAANWNTDGVPASTDDVDLTGANTININVAAVANNLTLNNAGLTLTINSGNSLATSGNLTLTSGTLNTANAFPTVAGTVNVAAGTVGYTAASGSQTVAAQGYVNLTISGGGAKTLAGTITPSGDLIISGGTFDLSNYTCDRSSTGGTLTVSNGATLKIGETNPLPSNYTTHSVGATSTVEYYGSNQSIAVPNSSQSYGHLTLSGSGTKTAAGALTIAGSFTINSGPTFVAGSYTHTMQGDFSNSGTFSAGTSTIQFTGNTDVTLTGATTFNILIVNKSASTNTVTLANNISVATLTMTQGNILTGSNVVTATSDRTGNGLIIGTITRTHTFNASTSYTFEGPYTSLTFASGGTLPTSITLTTTLSSPGATTSMDPISRYYTISQMGGSGFSYTLRLHYEDAEVSSPNSETSPVLKVWRRTSTGPDIWTREGSSASNTTNNWVEQSGITNTGTFSLSSRTIANMVLTFLQSVTNPSPGDQVTYTLQYSNSGDGTSTNTLFTASAPLQTTYVGGSIKINGVSKTDAADADEVTVSGSSISINLGTVASGASGDFIYKVTVN